MEKEAYWVSKVRGKKGIVVYGQGRAEPLLPLGHARTRKRNLLRQRKPGLGKAGIGEAPMHQGLVGLHSPSRYMTGPQVARYSSYIFSAMVVSHVWD